MFCHHCKDCLLIPGLILIEILQSLQSIDIIENKNLQGLSIVDNSIPLVSRVIKRYQESITILFS